MMATNSSMADIPIFGGGELELVNNLIGSGGMGVVSLYKWKVENRRQKIVRGREVAVKKLEKTSDVQSIEKEAQILWRVQGDCKYILRFYGLLKSPEGICLVLEYMQYSNISHFFKQIKRNCGNMDLSRLWPLKCRIAWQICLGMDYLHNRQSGPILHCDLKAANVLLDNDLDVKICDFGLAKIKRLTMSTKSDGVSKETLNHQPAGTLSHVAPELLSGKERRPNKKSDVYSFGILLWELMSDRSPYEDVQHDFILSNGVLKGQRPESSSLPVDSPKLLKDIMTESWNQRSEKRPEFSELRHRFSAEHAGRAVENSDIGISVAFARASWEEASAAETRPKDVLSHRSEETPHHYFQTHNLPAEPALPVMQQDRDLSDIDIEDLRISKSSRGCGSSVDTERKDSTFFVENPQLPLIDPAPRPLTPQRVGKTWARTCKVVGLVIVVAIFAAAAFAGGRYGLPNVNKGCCVQCFNQSNPTLQSTCSFRGFRKKGAAPPGGKCKFSCADGYVLNGNATELTCNAGGVWSGPMPYCRKTRQCPLLDNPANGGTMHCTNANYEKSKCSFTCPENYRLRLPGDSVETGKVSDGFNVTCQADAVLNFLWSGKEPYCEEIVSCSPPTIDKSVHLECTSPPDDENGRTADQETTYTNGTVCHCSCGTHMSLETNEATMQCKDDGNWNTTAPVRCIQGCPAFEDPPHSKHSCTLDRKYNSRCIFSCDDNFVMVGTGNMVCASAGPVGQWTNKPPRCECPSCKSGASCQNSLRFQETWAAMNSSSTMNSTTYDGREIRCASKPKVFLKKDPDNDAFGCQCRDVSSNTIKQCNDVNSLSEACYKAYSSIVLMMAYNGTVALPCDADTTPLPGICK